LLIQYEFGWLDEVPAFLPPGSNPITDLSRYAVSNRERQVFSNFSSFFQGIDAGRNDLRAKCLELIQPCFVTG